MSSDPLSPAIILVEPREEGNIGAAARAMANMGLTELILVRPAAGIGRTARAFAVGAEHVLEAIKIEETLTAALQPFHLVVGTTSARARELPAPPVTPGQLPSHLGRLPGTADTAVLFGPEVSGLNNDQLSHCGLLIRIPCAPLQPTLNLAQAVLIVAYELYLARTVTLPNGQGVHLPATAGEIEGLFEQILPLLAGIGFQRDDTFEGVVRDLRRLAARARATSRDVSILRGICRRVRRTLERR